MNNSIRNTIRTRIFPESNYRSVFYNGKTIRMPIDPRKAVTPTPFQEFYDVGINTLCYAKCPWCYTSATTKGINFPNVVENIKKFFGGMNMNQRSYQVALGGSGEATIHPDFIEVLKTFYDLQVVPNYTTNGMHLTQEVLEATKEYCGGVAISLHPHLEKVWRKAIETLIQWGIKVNVHIIISDKESIDYFKSLYEEYNGRIDYFVLLPYMNVGFGGGANSKQIDYEYLESYMDQIFHNGNIAVGSNFYEWLKKCRKYNVSLYEPESFSAYAIFDNKDPNGLPALYDNSFNMKRLEWDKERGLLRSENIN